MSSMSPMIWMSTSGSCHEEPSGVFWQPNEN
jgi:hypothetical protein